MHIDVLEEDTLVRVGWVDVWVSLYWEDAYRTMGRFTLEVRPTPENLSLLREGRWTVTCPCASVTAASRTRMHLSSVPALQPPGC